jgi:hypothetical protein
MVTDMGLEKGPGAGLKVGLATVGGTKVYVEEMTWLSLIPLL